jgi:hypothetical protein
MDEAAACATWHKLFPQVEMHSKIMMKTYHGKYANE